METIKTALVVVLLLAVLFGAYTVLNRPDPQPPKEIAWLEKAGPDSLKLEIGTGEESQTNSSLPPPAALSKELATIGGNEKRLSFAPTSPLDSARPAPTLLDRSDASPAGDSRSNGDARLAPPQNDAARNSPVVPLPDLTDAPHPRTDLPRDMSWNNDKPSTNLSSPPHGNQQLGTVLPGYGPGPAPTTDANIPNGAAAAPQVVENPFFKNAGANSESNGFAPQNYSRDANGGSSYAKVSSFDQAYKTAQAQFAESRWRDALATLSKAYVDPNLTTAEVEKLLSWLDPLAGKVIYSTDHLLENPHLVQRGETLLTIAAQYNVPWQLLQNINNVRNPEFLIPGTRLKVVRGPFRAEVDLVGKELTMFVQELYAGRFPISVGIEPSPMPGDYEVRTKEQGHTFFGRDGRNVPPNDPSNPYGRCWIDLGRELSIHGSSSVDTGAPGQGCISLSPRDADDVFGILSQGSKVSIRR